MSEQPPRHAPKRATERASSLVLVNTGDGKGKTTAALGTALRAAGRGLRVCVVQFLKSPSWKTGEAKAGRELGIDWWTLGDGFTWDSENLTQDQAVAREAWARAKSLIQGDEYQLVVLDEITYPINWGWIEIDDVVGTIAERPGPVNIVCTGRNAATALIDVADTVSEVKEIKHAYKAGIRAKKGIDF
jgi:cob(I)alamin adenosyltransferase